MAIIRKRNLLEMSVEELEKKLVELGEEVLREKGTVATHGKPANAGRYREMRRTIARIKTLLSRKAQKK
ncbi:50S ribosomal protein L29 [Candidatus Micrarchaeota archaeon CG1_02_55_22]|nr:MAG: 50S ribosomal protein L29 [Candidatus Micrarchaeota archaeon CG1_02_55_22]